MPLPDLAHNDDELLTLNMHDLPVYEDFIPGIPGVDVQPLMLDTNRGIWVVRAWFHPGLRLPTHFHTGCVHLWTLSGCWYYEEYAEQPQTAGSYLYEPGSSVHTLVAPESNDGLTEIIVHVEGSNVNFDANGNYVGLLDANSITLGIDHLIRERGLDPARYIRPGQPDYTNR
ncbi:MAG: 2,4'-dihydroxyacetophenone dioxygenase [Salinisphaeraceae bacterium]|nr:2,4'-dihydroxyacetophenone dioxygenase [Salinisphaeraceae bacterium]